MSMGGPRERLKNFLRKKAPPRHHLAPPTLTISLSGPTISAREHSENIGWCDELSDETSPGTLTGT